MRLVPLVLAALGSLPALAAPPAVQAERASYLVAGPDAWRTVRTVERAGYRLVVSSPDGSTLVATVEVDGTPLRDDARYPAQARVFPQDALTALTVPIPPDPEADAAARMLFRGARTYLEGIESVIAYVARRVRYELPGALPESAALCLRRGWGSCVGRSLLAADLLVRAGVPARQVTGILTASSVNELTPASRPAFHEGISGIRHRWIEAYVPALGWVPSDPGGLANTVTARHVALTGPPEPGFSLGVLSRTAELRRPRLETGWPGLALKRPRAPSGGTPLEATELAPPGQRVR